MNRYFYDREKHFIIDSYTNEIVCLVNYDEEFFAIWVCRVLECQKDNPCELSDEILSAMREAYDKGINPTDFFINNSPLANRKGDNMNPLIDITITIYFVIEKFDEPYMYVKSEYSGCSDVNSNMLNDKFLYEERRKVADKNNVDVECVRAISKKEFESRNKDEYFSFE